MTRKYVIGTRGSDLALWQANTVKAALEANFPQEQFEIRIIHTTGDKVLDVALSKIGDKGLFTRQIEAELLEGRIDLAVHSLKDLQTQQPDGLTIGAVCERERPNDVFIAKKYRSLEDLPIGSKVATGSLRRKSQLLAYRSDLQIVEIRGNVPTRIRKFQDSDLDAMILAYAGVHRLGLGEHISDVIDLSLMLPAVGQGVVAIETRDGDHEVNKLVGKLNHEETRICITAERAYLRRLEGGCQVPIGAIATVDGDDVTLEGFVGDLNGTASFREKESGPASEAAGVGIRLAERLIALGAAELLTETRSNVEEQAENKVVM